MAGRRLLNGTAGNDRMRARFASEIDGLSGHDALIGSRFDDQILGGIGRDFIWAGFGRDTLDGGAGHDRVWGQGGADTFLYRIAENRGFRDIYSGGGGRDTLLLIGSVEAYFSASVQALAGIARNAARLQGLRGLSIEQIQFELPDGSRLDLKTDSAVTARADALRLTVPQTDRVEILGNDTVADLVRSVSLVSPVAGVSLEFERDPNAKGGQRAVLVFDPGSRFDDLAPGETTTRLVQVRITDADGDSAISTVTVTIEGRAQIPGQIAGGATGALVEDDPTTETGGVLTISDVNPGESRFKTPAAADLKGTYGAFSFNAATGTWNYEADASKLQPLKEGEVVTETLTVTSADGLSTQDIVVSLTGRDDVPVLKDAAGSISADSRDPLQGTLTVTDPDRGEAGVESFRDAVAGDYGSFTLTDQGDGTAAWSYLLNAKNSDLRELGPGEVMKDQLTVTTLDGTTLPLTVTITGVNDAPTGKLAVKGDAIVGETLSVAKGSLEDAEGLGEITWQWFRDGKAIEGAKAESYTLVLADAGAEISVRASYTDDKGSAETVEAGFGQVESPALLVTTLKDVVDAKDGLTSLREAIANAAAIKGTDEIRFHPDLEGAIHLQSQIVLSTGTVSIFGEGRITIDANADGDGDSKTAPDLFKGNTDRRAFMVDGADVTLDGLSVTGGQAVGGGAVRVDKGAVTIIDSRFTANSTPSFGGAVYGNGADTKIIDSWFEGNRGSAEGGAVYLAEISGSTFKGNASNNGGAVSASRVATSSFVGNTGFNSGGGTYRSDVTQSSFVGNSAGSIGPDVTFGSVKDSLLLSGSKLGSATDKGGNIILGRDVQDWSEVLAANTLDPATGHLLLKLDPLNPAIDRIADSTGKDALGNGPVDQPTLGKAGEIRDIGAVELPLVTGPQPAGIGGILSATITEDADSASGTLFIRDFDAGEAAIKTGVGSTIFGVFVVDLNAGEWRYLPDSPVHRLGPQDKVTETLTVTSVDGTASKTLTVTITGLNDAPTGALAISGERLFGETLTVTKGTLADAEQPGTLSYQWLRDGKEITGATRDSYTLGLDDAGKEISVRASYTDGKGTAESLTTAAGIIDSPALLVTTLSDTSLPGDGLTSLREAIANAAAKDGADEIRFANGLEGVIHLQGSELEILTGNAVSIFGGGRITIDANADGNETVEMTAPTEGDFRRILSVNGATVTLDGLTFTGGREVFGGAVNVFAGPVTIRDSVFKANAATNFGGAVVGTTGTTIIGSWFEGNRSGDSGGAVVAGSISGSTFKDNFAANDGGAVASSTVTTSSFVGNTSGSRGGAAFNSEITQSSFVGNTSPAGGDLFLGAVSTSLLLSDSKFHQSVADIGNNIVLGREVVDPRQVLASLDLDPVTGHLRLKTDVANPALDRIKDTTGTDALGNSPVDYPSIGDEGAARDVGAVELIVTGPQPAVITGDIGRFISEDAGQATGRLTIRDFDAGEAKFQDPGSLARAYGSFTFDTATGAWTYIPGAQAQTLGTNEQVSDTLLVTSLDGQASRTITVTLTGANDAPTGALSITGARELGETLNVSKGTLADAEELGEITWQWLRDGKDIPGATKDSYTLGLDDAGREISVRASYTDGKGAAESLTTAAGSVGSPALLVTTLSDTSTANDGLTSLREAIANAAAKPGADEIRFHPDLKGVIHLQGSQFVLAGGNDVSIFGEGRITLDANADGNNTVETSAPTSGDRRALLVDGADVKLGGLTFTGGRADNGGAVRVQSGTVTIYDSRFIANSARDYGGAIYDVARSVTITDSWFEGNSAYTYAGAVYGGDIGGSTFKQNSATRGGAVGASTVTTSSFVGNSATNGGAAIASIITQSSFVGSKASNGPDVSGGSVSTSLLLSGNALGGATDQGNNIVLVRDVQNWSEVLADNTLDPVTGHLLLKADPFNKALDRIADSTGKDALGTSPIDYPSIGDVGKARDVGAVELIVTGPQPAGIAGDLSVTITEDAGSASGTLTIRDFNAGEASFKAATDLNGEFGSFTFDAPSGGWTLTPGAEAQKLGGKDQVTDTLTVESQDGTTATITVTITGANDAPTGALAVTGVLAAGQTLSVDKGTLEDAEGLGTLGYQWLRDGQEILGATKATYTLTAADAGAEISVRAGYTDGKGTAESVTATAGTVDPLSLLVTTLSDTSTAGDGLTSLREAIANARTNAGPDEIRFAEGLEGVIHLSTNLEIYRHEVSIFGEGRITIDANIDGNSTVETTAPTSGTRSALEVDLLSGAVVLDGLGFTGGRSGSGGGVTTRGPHTLIIRDSVFSANAATASGGAIYAYPGATIDGSYFVNNVSGGSGGAIAFVGVSGMVVKNSSFRNNKADDKGGAVFQGTVETSSFVGNVVDVEGGATFDTWVSQSSFVDNQAPIGADVSRGSISNSLVLSGGLDVSVQDLGGNIILGRDVQDWSEVLAANMLDPVTGHLLLKADSTNPALDRIDDDSGRDALGNLPVDLPGVGLAGLERDLGAVELLSLIG